VRALAGRRCLRTLANCHYTHSFARHSPALPRSPVLRVLAARSHHHARWPPLLHTLARAPLAGAMRARRLARASTLASTAASLRSRASRRSLFATPAGVLQVIAPLSALAALAAPRLPRPGPAGGRGIYAAAPYVLL